MAAEEGVTTPLDGTIAAGRGTNADTAKDTNTLGRRKHQSYIGAGREKNALCNKLG
jgi:hypothetical protein